MKKIQLDILDLSSSAEKNRSYAIVLGEMHGFRRIPIVIGAFEAQAIVVSLENIRPGRPLTHDLFHSFLQVFSIELLEVVIYKYEESVFFSKLVCLKDGVVVEIDSRTSDALALAVRVSCPIYTYETVLEATGSVMNPRGATPNEELLKAQQLLMEEEDANEDELISLSLKDLEELLEEVLKQEDYAAAIAIRDEIERRKK